jgi:hypothetical protein
VGKPVDLEELERNAREWSQEDADWYPGCGPKYTLALIARIRELEDALRMQCDRLDNFHEVYTKVSKDPLNVREILDKGAVLP